MHPQQTEVTMKSTTISLHSDLYSEWCNHYKIILNAIYQTLNENQLLEEQASEMFSKLSQINFEILKNQNINESIIKNITNLYSILEINNLYEAAKKLYSFLSPINRRHFDMEIFAKHIAKPNLPLKTIQSLRSICKFFNNNQNLIQVILPDVKVMKCQYNKIIFMDTRSNKLYLCYWDGYKKKHSILNEFVIPENEIPVQVAGTAYSGIILVLCESGKLYTGKNNQHKDFFIDLKEVRLLDNEMPSILIDSDRNDSNSHIMIITKKHKLFGMGANENGQLGIYNTTKNEAQPVRVRLPTDELVSKVAIACNHTIVLCQSGNVYSFGSNDEQLGQGQNPRIIIYPQRINLPNNELGIDIVTQGDRTFIISSGNNCYACGITFFGSLGINQDSAGIFTHIDINGIPKKIFLGLHCGFIQCQNGEIFSFGKNSIVSSTTPVLFPAPENEIITHFITSDNAVLHNCNSYKQILACCASGNLFSFRIYPTYVNGTFLPLAKPRNEEISHIRLTDDCASMITNKGNLYLYTLNYNHNDHPFGQPLEWTLLHRENISELIFRAKQEALASLPSAQTSVSLRKK